VATASVCNVQGSMASSHYTLASYSMVGVGRVTFKDVLGECKDDVRLNTSR
jgi:hypothetical protein